MNEAVKRFWVTVGKQRVGMRGIKYANVE